MKVLFIILSGLLFLSLSACDNNPHVPEKDVLDAYLKAKQFYMQGKLTEAENEFRKITSMDPNFYQASLMLGKRNLFSVISPPLQDVKRTIPIKNIKDLLVLEVMDCMAISDFEMICSGSSF